MVNQADLHNYNRKKNNDNGINKDNSDRCTNNYNNIANRRTTRQKRDRYFLAQSFRSGKGARVKRK